MSTKLSSRLPKGTANGLDVIAQDLIADPARRHLVVGIVDCTSVTTRHDNGAVVPTAQFCRIEVVAVADAQAAQDLLRQASEARQGSPLLPLEFGYDAAEVDSP
ncbi:hypothetical protein JNUCC0626_19810 [Lentzea sp. JNUCC 0626]|uniref:hypothetical protein n=1 Tax=Lentzea sp. JNUCC 0626 TaxID=3367513 RepID=UPI003749F2A2